MKPTIPLTERLSELYTLRDEVEAQIANEEMILRKKWHKLPMGSAVDAAPSVVRQWARDHDIPVSPTGKISDSVRAAFQEAHE